MQREIRVSVLVAAILASGVACGDDDGSGPAGPTAGTLTMNLVTAAADDGGILIRVTGPGITQFAAADGAHYLYFDQSGQTVTAVLIGDIDAGPLVRFQVPDVSAASSYSGSVLEAADRANGLRGSVAGYELTVQ